MALAAREQLRIGMFYPHTQSVHVTSRVVADSNPDVLDPAVHRELAGAAEQVGFDFLFIANRWTPYGPAAVRAKHSEPNIYAPLLGALLTGVTRHIGLVTTIHTTYHHPVQIARMGANLDALSGGRWGFNIVTGLGAAERSLFGLPDYGHDEMYDRADEMLDAVKLLWESEGPVRFAGKFWDFEGWLSGPRPVQQPHPLLVNAGASPAGRAFAARHADWIFTVARDPAAVHDYMQDVAGQAEASGRARESVRVLFDANVIVRDTDREAQDVSDWIVDSLDLDAAREYAGTLMKNIRTHQQVYDGVPEDEVVRKIGSSAGGFRFHGSPSTVAEQIIDVHRRSGARGLAVSFPLWNTDEVRRFGTSVLPLLEQAGIWTNPHARGWTW